MRNFLNKILLSGLPSTLPPLLPSSFFLPIPLDRGDGLAVQEDVDELVWRRRGQRPIWETRRPLDVTLYDLLYDSEVQRCYGMLISDSIQRPTT